ncbi:putative sulfate permease C3H7.02 [Leucoagaricus sp. SymC.cos]|nr:putative sulfate permease C3H7.02 [Leucoagaricus sp. SymC.cos]
MVPSMVKKVSKKIVDHPEHHVEVISSKDWLSRFWTNPFPYVPYLLSLFPILGWIHRYNIGWLSGDLIAGLTVGIVVVPQGMSYAQIATLPPEYGLYSSFVGVFIYCFFATSKDVSIGPVAVMSLTVASIISHVQEHHPGEWDKPIIATTVGLIAGFIVLGIGLLRLGWLVEFQLPPAFHSGFMTGSVITIAVGQAPGLLGITGFSTRAATYKVIINTLRGLPDTKLDAAWGVTGLVSLYTIRFFCTWGSRRWPRKARWFFFMNVLRNAFVILILTIGAWLYCRKRRDTKGNFPIRILKDVPAGLKHVGVPEFDDKLISAMASELPVATIILFLEHIAISKSFGRLNGYKINPNQELIAIGAANTIGACFGAYPATGSFSRSALQSKSGVRTPLAGVATSVVVIVALYGLTDAFFWIPNAALCAVIIHAVADLVASPAQVYYYWRISPLEFLIWVAAVFVTVFTSVENGIYTSIAASLVLLLIRVAHPRGTFLGKISVESETEKGKTTRDVYVPIKKNGVNNPHIKVIPPAPGVIVYRFEESYLYPNCTIVNSALVDYVRENMRRGKDLSAVSLRDRPWNDSGPRTNSALDQTLNEKKPWLHAIILDFSSVSHLDTTATQALIDTRAKIERWTDYPVEFHFATVLSPWISRALVAGGFGYGASHSRVPREVAAVVPYRDGAVPDDVSSQRSSSDIETGNIKTQVRAEENPAELRGWELLTPQDTPFFHIDLPSAVRAAESGLHRIEKFDIKSEGKD